jgi:hypothetical protein
MRHRRWFVVALCLGAAHGDPAFAAESITVTLPADAIQGDPFSMTVATTSDSPSTSSVVVWVRQDDRSPCQASSSAVGHALPAAVEVYADRRRTEPVTFDVAGLPFAGAMRICGFVQIVPAPQTTLSAQDIVAPIRAPTGTLQLQPATARPFFGDTLAVTALGSSEAVAGSLAVRAQRGGCAPPSADELENVAVEPLTGGAFNLPLEAEIGTSPTLAADRVCGWLWSDGGLLLATAEQAIQPQFDGAIAVVKKRFLTRKRHHRAAAWLLDLKAHIAGSVDTGSIRLKIASGGRCVDTQARLLRHGFEWLCTLKSRPRAPFRFRLTYSTGLELNRATRRITIAVPKRQHRKHRH